MKLCDTNIFRKLPLKQIGAVAFVVLRIVLAGLSLSLLLHVVFSQPSQLTDEDKLFYSSTSHILSKRLLKDNINWIRQIIINVLNFKLVYRFYKV